MFSFQTDGFFLNLFISATFETIHLLLVGWFDHCPFVNECSQPKVHYSAIRHSERYVYKDSKYIAKLQVRAS